MRMAPDATVGEVAGARAAVQGFGAVGRNAARYLARDGARRGRVRPWRCGLRPRGLGLDGLLAFASPRRSVGGFPGTEQQAFALIDEKLAANTAAVLTEALEHDMPPRDAVEETARRRVAEAEHHRRHC
jgi:glutamate dehydrogenase (NAD(P)+)